MSSIYSRMMFTRALSWPSVMKLSTQTVHIRSSWLHSWCPELLLFSRDVQHVVLITFQFLSCIILTQITGYVITSSRASTWFQQRTKYHILLNCFIKFSRGQQAHTKIYPYASHQGSPMHLMFSYLWHSFFIFCLILKIKKHFKISFDIASFELVWSQGELQTKVCL